MMFSTLFSRKVSMMTKPVGPSTRLLAEVTIDAAKESKDLKDRVGLTKMANRVLNKKKY